MAAKTRAELTTQINTLLADNTNNEITAEDLRNIVGFCVESMYNLADDDQSEIDGLQAAITSNTSVAANTAARHAHIAAAAASADVVVGTKTINDDSTGIVGTRINPSVRFSDVNDNFATLLDLAADNRLKIIDVKDKVNAILVLLRNYGILTP